MTETRKLAAILAADVVGFSRLAGTDEDRTLARLRALRSDLIDPTIAVHHGRIVKRTGDGALVEFRSVVDAVRCAIEVQNGMTERNAGLPADRRIDFRIGIHLGDVVEESDGDLMGDGVNIAARLEGVARPGTICLSEDAYRQVRSRLDLKVSDLGATQLKNIAEPVRVYALEVGVPAEAKAAKPEEPAPQARPGARKTRSTLALLVGGIAVLCICAGAAGWYFFAAKRPAAAGTGPLSIVVLPFNNLSGDPHQDYFADVLTDQLTTYISRIPGSFVIARNTAFTYKGKPTDVKQIGKDLGVRYALEGSVQPTGGRVRVNAQLIDTDSGAHLWAEAFDHDRAELLQMQDDIVTRLARTLQIQLTNIEAAKLQQAHPENPDAQELALRCQAAFFNFGAYGEQADAGLRFCEQALELDPNNVVALASMASVLFSRVFNMQSADRMAQVKRANELASRAITFGPNSPDAHAAKAQYFMATRRFDDARAELERAIALNPSQMNAYTGLCALDLWAGQPEKIISCVDKAVHLSPRDSELPTWFDLEGNAYIMLRRDDKAVEALRRTGDGWGAELAGALALAGHEAEAREALQHYLSLPETRAKTIAALKTQVNSDNPVYLAMHERVYEGLRKAGMPEQ